MTTFAVLGLWLLNLYKVYGGAALLWSVPSLPRSVKPIQLLYLLLPPCSAMSPLLASSLRLRQFDLTLYRLPADVLLSIRKVQ